MRKPQCSTTVSAQFRCPADAVWRVLQSAEAYGEWFGYPDSLECSFIDPSFSPGARLRFKNDPTTKVITVYETERRLALADDISREEITIKPNEAGCIVALSLASYKAAPPAQAALDKQAETMLKALKTVSYDTEKELLRQQEEPAQKRKDDWLLAGVRGYKRPVLEGREKKAKETDEQTVGSTESDVALPRRSLAVVLVLAILLFAVLGVGLRFERGDIVPSSGLSLTESEYVNRLEAEQVDFSMTKNTLERKLSCQGLRLNAETYYYCSTERLEDGTPREQMYVTYDAFGNIRRYAYINQESARARVPLVVGGLGDVGGRAIGDINSYISSSMTFEEIEAVVGQKLCAFVVDKSGLISLFFGRLNDQLEIFDSYANAQLVVKLDRSANSSTVRYYQTYTPKNPLPFALEGTVGRQYSQRAEYLLDRNAYERSFMIKGLSREQVDILLATEGVEYEQNEAEETSRVSYYLNNAVSSSAGYRYEYLVLFKSGRAADVVMTNQFLYASSQVMPGAEQVAKLKEGTTLFETYGAIDMLPSSVHIEENEFTLFYGSGNSKDHPLTVAFDATQRIVSIKTDLLTEGEL